MIELYKKTINRKQRQASRQAGMTYAELIVVLSIFSIISSVAIFNYGDFEDRVQIKNLASDIALKFVEAQKSSLSGQLPPLAELPPSTWKPSYGVYFDIANNGSFIYFTDLNNNGLFDDSDCTGECLAKINLSPEGFIVSNLNVFYQGDESLHSLDDVTMTFARPNSGAIIHSSGLSGATVSYVQVTITSPNGATALIKLYSSGRIQVN